jgi:hypothetical protein
MPPERSEVDLSMSVLMLLLGWALGLLSPAIVEGIRRRRDGEKTHLALKAELDELSLRAALVSHMIQMRFGVVNREHLEWLRDALRRYKGSNEAAGVLSFAEKLLSQSDEVIATVAATDKARPGRALRLKKLSAPIVDSRLPIFWQLDEGLQRQLLEIKTHLDFVNEDIDDARYYFQLSFSNLSEKNDALATQNLTACYLQISDRAKIVVNKIALVSRL